MDFLTLFPYLATGLLALVVILLAVVLTRRTPPADLSGTPFAASQETAFARLEARSREDAATLRAELERAARGQREELAGSMAQLARGLTENLAQLGAAQKAQLDSFAQQLATLTRTVNEQLAASATQDRERADALRATVDEKLAQNLADARLGREEAAASLQRFGAGLNEQLQSLTKQNSERLEQLRTTVEGKLKDLQSDNSQKLEQMRATVDEKLHATLEKRLGESFAQVSERLEQVHKGLGEMQNLAAGVGDLKKVLTNVKTRGTWGEMQLGNLLEQVLTPEQFEFNVATRPGSADRVEFAIRLPGKGEADKPVWLPIDAKFPVEDYQRLQDAQERAEPAAIEDAARQIEIRIKAEAKTIRDKYVEPPHTTDFAILYLPTEGLFAEVLRRPGLSETLQRDYRVTIAGPTTLTAMLNSLQMGFRTLAIEKRSSEVWRVLGEVKTEFGKFGDVLEKTQQKLEQASKSIEQAGVRTRAIERKLRGVEAMPVPDAPELLGSRVDSEAEAD